MCSKDRDTTARNAAPLRIAYVRFTSCSGCQLTLLNCERDLPEIARRFEVVSFAMATSAEDDGGPLDAALVEGSISRTEELEALLEFRQRAQVLIAVGACALTGGVNVLAVDDRSRLCASVYGGGAPAGTVFPPQPLYRFTRVDHEIAGCPPERGEHLRTLGALLLGGLPALPEYAVCMECRRRENRCLLLEDRQPCLGPLTRAGCDALCPSFGAPCEGCRGEVVEANRDEGFRLLIDLGLSEGEVRARMGRFAGVLHGPH